MICNKPHQSIKEYEKKFKNQKVIFTRDIKNNMEELTQGIRATKSFGKFIKPNKNLPCRETN